MLIWPSVKMSLTPCCREISCCWGPLILTQHRITNIFQTSILFKTNKFHGETPCSGGPGAIASVAPPSLIRPWVELFSPFKESIIVGTIYFHPNNSVNEFSRNLENTIIKLNNQRQTFYILEDFNINLLSDSRLTHAYLNSLTSLGVHCLINKPRFMHNCTPLLDHIYTNDNLHYLYPGLFPLDISDYLPSC